MENRFAFTKAALVALKAPASGRFYVYDTDCTGLALCITDRDARTYYRIGRVQGQPRRIRIGTFRELTIDQARRAAKKINAEVADDKDPVATRKTFGEYFRWYMIHHSKPHKRTWKRDESHHRLYLAVWDRKRITAITREDIQRIHTRITGENGPGAANNVLYLIRHVLGKAVEDGWIDRNVSLGIRGNPKHERERYLQPHELEKFFAAVAALQRETTRDFILMTLMTGGRRQNVLSMRWDEINLDAGVWELSGSRFKNKKPVVIVLSPEAIAILRRRLENREASCPWVFPGQSVPGHLNDPKAAWERIKKLSGIDNIVIHDLRRTLGSWQANQGTSLHVIGKSLGHQSVKSTAIYARLQMEPVRESVTKAVGAIMEAAKPKSAEAKKDSSNSAENR